MKRQHFCFAGGFLCLFLSFVFFVHHLIVQARNKNTSPQVVSSSQPTLPPSRSKSGGKRERKVESSHTSKSSPQVVESEIVTLDHEEPKTDSTPTPVPTPEPRVKLTQEECLDKVNEKARNAWAFMPPECQREWQIFDQERRRLLQEERDRNRALSNVNQVSPTPSRRRYIRRSNP